MRREEKGCGWREKRTEKRKGWDKDEEDRNNDRRRVEKVGNEGEKIEGMGTKRRKERGREGVGTKRREEKVRKRGVTKRDRNY